MFLPHLLEMDVGCPKSHQLTLGLNLINGENFAKFHSQHFSCPEVEHTYMWTHAETHTHTNKQTNKQMATIVLRFSLLNIIAFVDYCTTSVK